MEVPLTLLHAVAELPEETLHRGLAQLQAAEFLYETRLFPEREYTFKHALTHEVAYGSLLQERRRVLHAQIVEALEALAGDPVAEQVERLAHHALRGEVWDKALAYCRQAGEKALARSAHREAVCWLAAWRRRRPSPSGRWGSPVSMRNVATRRMPCASSATGRGHAGAGWMMALAVIQFDAGKGTGHGTPVTTLSRWESGKGPGLHTHSGGFQPHIFVRRGIGE